jgi:predicted AAA+ superfamily ATPase
MNTQMNTHVTQPVIQARLSEMPRFIIVLDGPRKSQKDKMGIIKSVLDGRPSAIVSTASDSTIQEKKNTAEWLINQWTSARARAKEMPAGSCYVLAIDGIQKIPRWSEIVKGLWDADRAVDLNLHVILLLYNSWLHGKGLKESLAGRFEPICMGYGSIYDREREDSFSIFKAFPYEKNI